MVTFKEELKQKKSRWIFALAVLLVIVGVIVQFKKSEKSSDNDFRVYYKTSVRLQNSEWEDIYTRKDGAFPYRYVPYTIPALTWVAKMSEPDSRKVWVVLQSLGFAIGFYFLYKSLVLTGSSAPVMHTGLGFILTYRQFMDSLYSGQVAGFIFLSFCLGLYFYLKGRLISDGISNSIASSLKIFPGVLLIHGLIKSEDYKKRMQYLLSGILLFGALNLLCWLWLMVRGQEQIFILLWKNWVHIITSTGEYFDGATPKSQALRAFLLRTFGKSEAVETAWKIMTVSGILLLAFHWFKGKSETALQDAYSYCLGIMAFIIFMPESLPYQLMNVAIPFVFFLSDPKLKTEKLFKFTLVCFMLFISFASTDFIGRKLSDEVQALSIAFFVLCLLSFILVKETRARA